MAAATTPTLDRTQPQRVAMLRPDDSAPPAWGVASHVCDDGQNQPLLSSLANGETRRGVLRSRTFMSPNALTFHIAGHSRQGANFVRLHDARTDEVILEQPAPGTDQPQRVEWNLVEHDQRYVYLELQDDDDGSGRAWLAFGRLTPEVVPMPQAGATDPPEGWNETPMPARRVSVDGMPYLAARLLAPAEEGAAARLDLPPLRARRLWLLGGVNSVDLTHPAWGGTDGFRNFFLGDRIGTLRLGYASGVVDELPLICGYTAWWRQPYRTSPAPFNQTGEARELLDAALCVANGLDGFRPDAGPYYLNVALRDEPLAWIEHRDSPARIGHLEIEALTFAGVNPEVDEQRFDTAESAPVEPGLAAWLEAHVIDPANEAWPRERRTALDELRRRVHTHAGQMTDAVIDATPPAITPENFAGPRVTFRGTPVARILERVYYENAHGLLGRVDEDGMVHESEAEADRFDGFGGYTPDLGAYYTDAYTRLRGLTVLGHQGFADEVNRAIGFFDHWMMYFPQSYPKLQLGGKPVPAHTTVIANKPHVYFDVLRHHGWPTRYATRDFGNPENDGHGLLMLTRYRAWLKQGSTPEWVRARWEALHAAAEYIPWCLENPELSFSDHGLLYNESEAGLAQHSMYCDLVCYLGLLAYAEMAEAIGRDEDARRWTGTARGLAEAMDAYYPLEVEPFGEIWNPQRCGGFLHGSLAPFVIGMDLWGYDVWNRMPPHWRERTRRTYERQRTLNRPLGAAAGGMGYGQCYITQAALLSDEFDDAEQMVEWMTRMCFAPELQHPYRVPEGSIVSEDAATWRRWGDLGNLYQLVEVVHTIHLMLGIDDYSSDALLLMPRFPRDWTEARAERWPVRVTSGGASALTHLDYHWSRHERGIEFRVASDTAIDRARLRLGPFARGAEPGVTIDGEPVEVETIEAGDGVWVWVDPRIGAREITIAVMP